MCFNVQKERDFFLRINSGLGSNCQVTARQESVFVPEMLFWDAKCCREIGFGVLKFLRCMYR